MSYLPGARFMARIICGMPAGGGPLLAAVEPVANFSIERRPFGHHARPNGDQYDALAPSIPTHLAALVKQLETQERG
jgi:hypothetical protein